MFPSRIHQKTEPISIRYNTSQLLLKPDDMLRKKPLEVWSAQISSATALFLVGIKAWASIKTHTLTLLSLLLDSGLDVVASGLNYYFIRKSFQKPDEFFPYGYGKAQSLSAFMQAHLIFFSAILLSYQSIANFLSGREITRVREGVYVLGISWITTLFLTLFLRYTARKTKSHAVRADAFHYETDLITNSLGFIALLIIERSGLVWIDAVFGIGMALYMGIGAYRIARTSAEELLDRALSNEEKKLIFEAIDRFHPLVKNPHDFRCRKSGKRRFIEFHIEVDRTMSFEKAHEIAEDLIEAIQSRLPEAEVVVHVDPEGSRR